MFLDPLLSIEEDHQVGVKSGSWAHSLRCRISLQIASTGHAVPGDVALLAEEVVCFLSGAGPQCHRRWWLSLLDVLSLLHPFRDDLGSERRLLLPALEKLHRVYELHHALLEDLDIPGALRAAFPCDESGLFQLPDTHEDLCQYQLPPIYMRDLAGCLGNVGAELARAQSMWRHSRGSTALALRTNLPMDLLPVTKPPRFASTLPFSPPITEPAEHVHHVVEMTGFDAAELLVRYRHMGRVIFLYLNRSKILDSCFYDLHLTCPSSIDPEHLVFSPFGILHVNPLTGSDTQELGAWHREAILCRAMRKIPFFGNFLRIRTLIRWKQNVKRIRFLQKCDSLNHKLIMAVPHYTASLQHIHRLLLELSHVPWLPQPSCYTYLDLEAAFSQTKSQAKCRLVSFLALVSQILRTVRDDTYIMVQTLRKDLGLMISSRRSDKRAAARRLSQAESWMHRLGSLSGFVGHLVCQNLCFFLQKDICSFVDQLIQSGSTSLKVDLEFGEQHELTLCPSGDYLRQSFELAFSSVMDCVLQSTTHVQSCRIYQTSIFPLSSLVLQVTEMFETKADEESSMTPTQLMQMGAVQALHPTKRLSPDQRLASYQTPLTSPDASHPTAHLSPHPTPRIPPHTSHLTRRQHPTKHLSLHPMPRIPPDTSHLTKSLASYQTPLTSPNASHPTGHLSPHPTPRIPPNASHLTQRLASYQTPLTSPNASHPTRLLSLHPLPRIPPDSSHLTQNSSHLTQRLASYQTPLTSPDASHPTRLLSLHPLPRIPPDSSHLTQSLISYQTPLTSSIASHPTRLLSLHPTPCIPLHSSHFTQRLASHQTPLTSPDASHPTRTLSPDPMPRILPDSSHFIHCLTSHQTPLTSPNASHPTRLLSPHPTPRILPEPSHLTQRLASYQTPLTSSIASHPTRFLSPDPTPRILPDSSHFTQRLASYQTPLTLPNASHPTRRLSLHPTPCIPPDASHLTRLLASYQTPLTSPSASLPTPHLASHQTPLTSTNVSHPTRTLLHHPTPRILPDASHFIQRLAYHLTTLTSSNASHPNKRLSPQPTSHILPGASHLTQPLVSYQTPLTSPNASHPTRLLSLHPLPRIPPDSSHLTQVISVLSEEKLRSVLPGTETPPVRSRGIAGAGGLKVQGMVKISQILPLKLKTLQNMLYNDKCIQQARQSLQRVLGVSLCEVQRFCVEHSWMSDVHAFVRGWSSAVQEKLCGSSAKEYEDLLVSVRSWQDRVISVRVKVSAPGLMLCCTHIQEEMGPALTHIIQDILLLLASDISHRSRLLIEELDLVQSLFQSVSIEIPTFTEFTKKKLRITGAGLRIQTSLQELRITGAELRIQTSLQELRITGAGLRIQTSLRELRITGAGLRIQTSLREVRITGAGLRIQTSLQELRITGTGLRIQTSLREVRITGTGLRIQTSLREVRITGTGLRIQTSLQDLRITGLRIQTSLLEVRITGPGLRIQTSLQDLRITGAGLRIQTSLLELRITGSEDHWCRTQDTDVFTGSEDHRCRTQETDVFTKLRITGEGLRIQTSLLELRITGAGLRIQTSILELRITGLRIQTSLLEVRITGPGLRIQTSLQDLRITGAGLRIQTSLLELRITGLRIQTSLRELRITGAGLRIQTSLRELRITGAGLRIQTSLREGRITGAGLRIQTSLQELRITGAGLRIQTSLQELRITGTEDHRYRTQDTDVFTGSEDHWYRTQDTDVFTGSEDHWYRTQDTDVFTGSEDHWYRTQGTDVFTGSEDQWCRTQDTDDGDREPEVDFYTNNWEAVQPRMDYVNSLYQLLQMNYRQPTQDEESLHCKLIESWDNFHQHLKIASDFLSSNRFSMSAGLEQSFLSCYREAEALIVACRSPRFMDPSQDALLVLRVLGDMYQRLHALMGQLRELSRSRLALQGNTFDISEISKGEKEVLMREAVWKLLNISREQISDWKRTLFMKLNVEWMKEKMSSWDLKLKELALVTPEEDIVICTVKLILNDFTQLLPLLKSLANPALNRRHWEAIFTGMGKRFPGLETLTLGDLLMFPLLHHRDGIQKVCLEGQAELTSLQKLKKLQLFWQEKEFRLAKLFLCVRSPELAPDLSQRPPSGKFRKSKEVTCTVDSGTFLLIDEPSLCSLIDDSLLSLSTMRMSPLSSDVQNQVSDWIQKLGGLGHSLDLWIQFQEKWVFITKVLYEMDLPPLDAEKMKQFQVIDQSYRSFLNVTIEDPHALSILGPPQRRREWNLYGEGLCSAFQKGIGVMENVLQDMECLLDSSRSLCPRLYFLSNKDLLRILSASAQLAERTQCALLCFPSLHRLLYKVQTHQTLTIGVEGKYGERLDLISPISVSLHIISWLSVLEQELRKSVRYQLGLRLAERRTMGYLNLNQPELSKQWAEQVTSYPWQCLAVSEEVLWCEEMEAHLFSHQRASLRDRHNQKLEALVQSLLALRRAGSLPKSTLCQAQAVLSTWIMLASVQRDRVCNLLDGVGQTLESFAWAKILKYRAAPNVSDQDYVPVISPMCFGDVLGYQLPYDNEYIGLESSSIYSTFSDRTTLGLILALEHLQCGTVIGQDEGSRTHTVLALGNALGRQVVVLKCWAGIEMGRLSQHLQGALQVGAWLLLDSVHRLKREVQSLLGQLLWHIQSSCQVLRPPERSVPGLVPGQFDARVIGDIQFEGRSISVGQCYGCFITLPHLSSSSEIPATLRLVLRPVSLLSPDLRFTAELTLLAAGFQKHVRLACRISYFFRLAQESLALSPTISCSLMKDVIHKAASFLKMSFSQDPNDNMETDNPGAGGSSEEMVKLPQTGFILYPVKSSSVRSEPTDSLEERLLLEAVFTSSLWSSVTSTESSYLRLILQGVFPEITTLAACFEPDSALLNAINLDLKEAGLEDHEGLTRSVVQLFHAIQQRSLILLTGYTGSGKTTCWRVLSRVLNRLTSNEEPPGVIGGLQKSHCYAYHTVQTIHLYPDSWTPGELFGEEHDGLWKKGILSNILLSSALGSRALKWLVLDGLSSPLLAEPISCLIGPSPGLTLSNGERLHLPESIKIVFEMEDTSSITPAVSTVCGFVHCGGKDTWRAILGAFLSMVYVKYKVTSSTVSLFQSLCDTLIPSTLTFLETSCVSALHPHSAHSARGVPEVSSFSSILQALMDQYLLRDHATLYPQGKSQQPTGQALGIHGEDLRASVQAATHNVHESMADCSKLTSIDQHIPPLNQRLAQTCFIYSFIWGFAGHLDPNSFMNSHLLLRMVEDETSVGEQYRPQIDIFLRQSLSNELLQVPLRVSVFEVSVDPEVGTLVPSPPARLKEPIGKEVFLPQLESSLFAVRGLVHAGRPVLLVGSPGCGKTSLIQSVTFQGMSTQHLPFNPTMFPGHLRHLLDEVPLTTGPKAQLRRHRVRHLFLLDDLHKATYDLCSKTSPVLETLRDIMSHAESESPCFVPRCSFMGTACPPQDGTGSLCPRLTRLFCIFVLPPFGVDSLLSVFTPRLTLWLKKALPLPQAMALGTALAQASICLYNKVAQTLPAHYCFSLHHLHRLIHSMTLLCPSLGPLLSPPSSPTLPAQLLTQSLVSRLWMHEALRIFSDLLESSQEREEFRSLLLKCAMDAFFAPGKNHQDGHDLTEVNPSSDQAMNSPCPSHPYGSPSPEEYILPSHLLGEETLQDLNFCHLLKSGTREQVQTPIFKVQPGPPFWADQSTGLILCPEDQQHIAHLTRVLLLPQGHAALLSRYPATGRRCLATLAAQLVQCPLLELNGRETLEDRHALFREVCWKASAIGTGAALLVHEGAPQEALLELSALMHDGTFLGLHSEEEEDSILQYLKQNERSVNKNGNKKALKERKGEVVVFRGCTLGYRKGEVVVFRGCTLGYRKGEVVVFRGCTLGYRKGEVVVFRGCTLGYRKGEVVVFRGCTLGYRKGEVVVFRGCTLGYRKGEVVVFQGCTLGYRKGEVVVFRGCTLWYRKGEVVVFRGCTLGYRKGEVVSSLLSHYRFCQLVRENLHIVLLYSSLKKLPLTELVTAEQYEPWSLHSLQHVAEQLLSATCQPWGTWTCNISLPVVMSHIHQSAHNYCIRHCPLAPLTTPRVFLAFIQTFLRYSASRSEDMKREEERLRAALSRVQEVRIEKERCSEELSIITTRQHQADKEVEHWRQQLGKVQESAWKVRVQCDSLGRMKEYTGAQLNIVRTHRLQELEETMLRWAAVQNELKVCDIEEMRSYRSPPPLVVMVTDVLCAIFEKEPGWDSAKKLLGQEDFFQMLEYYDVRGMSDAAFSCLTRAVHGDAFHVDSVMPASVAAAALWEWLRGLQCHAAVLRHLRSEENSFAHLEAQEMEIAEQMSESKLQEHKLKEMEAKISMNLQKAERSKEELANKRSQLQQRYEVVRECERQAEPHASNWTHALKVQQTRTVSASADALLVAASVSYLGSLPWPRFSRLLDKWQSLCRGIDLPLNPDDVREALESPRGNCAAPCLREMLCTPAEHLDWQRNGLLLDTETEVRALLLRTNAHYSPCRPTLIIDPRNCGGKWLVALLGELEEGRTTEPRSDNITKGPESDANRTGWNGAEPHSKLCVVDSSDAELSPKVHMAQTRGLWLLITHVEQNSSILSLLHRLRSESGITEGYCDPMDHTTFTIPAAGDTRFHIFLSTSLSLSTLPTELGCAFLKEVNVMDLSCTGLEAELLREVVLLKDPRLQEQRNLIHVNTLQVQEKLRQVEFSLLDFTSLGPLLLNDNFLQRISQCEETQRILLRSLADMESLQRQISDSLRPHVSAAQSGCFLFWKLQELSRLSSHYYFPAVYVLRWVRSALQGSEGGVKVEVLLTQAILAHVLPMLTQEHKQVLRVLLASGQSPALEWLSFLGLAHTSIQGTLPSCIQRPPWIKKPAWEELGHLENLPPFRGIRSSLSVQTSQWREYFRLQSTVIGPVPCSHFAHLSVLQTAILWRILHPEKLGMVLAHLTACILGPMSADWEEQEKLSSLTDTHTPVVFLLPRVGFPGPSCHPLPLILRLAREGQKQVKVAGRGQAAAEVIQECQRDGHWILINCGDPPEWELGLKGALTDLLRCNRDAVNPNFRVWIIIQEEAMSALPACVRLAALPVPCGHLPSLRSFLLQSCRTSTELLRDKPQSKEALQVLILHSILLRRQEYNHSAQAEIYSWSQNDLLLSLHILERLASVCTDTEETLHFLTGSVIYGGHIVDEGDAESVKGVIKHCLTDNPLTNRGISNLQSLFTGRSISGCWLHRFQQFVQNVSLLWEPSVLGLSEDLQNTACEDTGRKVMSALLRSQDVWTQKTFEQAHLKNHYKDSSAFDRHYLNQESYARTCSQKTKSLNQRLLSQSLELLGELESRHGSIQLEDLLSMLGDQEEKQEDGNVEQYGQETEQQLEIRRNEVLQENQPMDKRELGQEVKLVWDQGGLGVELELLGGQDQELKRGAVSDKHGVGWPGKVNIKKERPVFTERQLDIGALSQDGWSQRAGQNRHPLLRFLLAEWELLGELIRRALRDLKDAMSTCRCGRCLRVREAVFEGAVPQEWNVYPSAPTIGVTEWIQGLHVRLTLLSSYISTPSQLQATYNLSVFQRPVALLHSLLQETAWKENSALDGYSLHLQVSQSTSPPAGRFGVMVTGLHLKHALWDTRLGLLQETLSSKLCALPLVYVEAVQEHDSASHPTLYMCPVYMYEVSTGPAQQRKEAILLLPLPTRIPPAVWSQRCVHATSLL
ncbi:dynein heavy chain domain-containing protein 1 [Pelodytes ibericus]